MYLLTHIKLKLKTIGRHHKEIIYIGTMCESFVCTWDEFCKLCTPDFEKDDCTIVQTVDYCNSELIISFNDGSYLTNNPIYVKRKEGGFAYIKPFFPSMKTTENKHQKLNKQILFENVPF